ncbi:MATE family efflux transporter [Gammaproteobacteria bacterium AS21]
MNNEKEVLSTQSTLAPQPVIAGNESITKVFWRYAIPSIAAMLANGLYQVIDGIFVGHYIGFEGLAAINMTMPIIGVIIGFGLMVGMGGGSLMSIYRGQGNTQRVRSILVNSLWLIIILALISTLSIFAFAHWLLAAQGALGDTLLFSIDYINIFMWGAVFAIAAAVIPMLIRNDNSPIFATTLMIFGAVLNVFLDYLLIGVYSLGLQGAAIATVASQALVTIIGIAYFFSAKSATKLSASKLTFNIKELIKIINLGASSLFMFLYFSLIIALHNKLLMAYGSPVSVAAFAIIGYIANIYYVTAEGIANGMQPPVSFYYGAKEAQKVKATLILALKAVIYSGVAIVVILNIFPDFFINLFSSDDPTLAAQTVKALRLHLLALFLDGFLFVASVYFMSVNQGTKALAISIGNIAVQLPFLYFLPQWLGINGVWLALPLSNVLITLVVAPMLWHDIKKTSAKHSSYVAA